VGSSTVVFIIFAKNRIPHNFRYHFVITETGESVIRCNHNSGKNTDFIWISQGVLKDDKYRLMEADSTGFEQMIPN